MRRRAFLAALLTAAPHWPARATASEAAAWAALAEGGIALFRHALAPGTGDPPGFQLEACATQRNLSAEGRAQAARIGAAFRARNITIGTVLSSPWCRARDTARIAFGGYRDEAAVSSFFADRAQGPAQTEAARALLAAWRGPGALIIVSHQVNITALTGIFPASGEAIVLRRGGSGPADIAGRLRFD